MYLAISKNKWLENTVGCDKISQAEAVLSTRASALITDRSERTMTALIDITGMRFGKLIAIDRVENSKSGKARWRCRCDCGEISEVQSTNLKSGASTSCGCVHKERLAARVFVHGGYGSRTYTSWINMHSRCNNSRNTHFHNYGGRGIEICERWNDFANFLADMGEKPKGLSIDRIDNNGNYEPGNCRWSTRKEQNLNKRNTLFIGDEKLMDVAERTGVKASILRWRVHRQRAKEHP